MGLTQGVLLFGKTVGDFFITVLFVVASALRAVADFGVFMTGFHKTGNEVMDAAYDVIAI